MTGESLSGSGHLHTFGISGRSYLVNGSTGHAFAIGESDAETGVCLDVLREFGHLDAVDCSSFDADLPPTGIGSVLLNVTHHCNLACAYCVMAMPEIRHAYQDERHSLTKPTGRACIDFLADAGYRDGVSLTFFGGEPLLRYDLIKHIVDYADATYPGRFSYQLITNGCLVRPEMYEFFRAHRFSFLWSLDGEPEVHDRLRRFKKAGEESVFARSFAALQALRAAWPDCRIGINITYFKQTLELPRALRFFRGHGIDAIRMDRGLVPRDSPHAVGLDDTPVAKAQLSEVAEAYLSMLLRGEVFSLNPFVNYMRLISKRLPRFRACNSGLDYVTVAATGEIYSCYKLLGLSDCNLGDVTHGFNREMSRQLWERLHVTKRPGCSGCWAKFICAGGCTADNRHLNNAYFAPARENCAIFLHAIELSIHLYFSLLNAAPGTLKTLLEDDHILDHEHPCRREAVVRADADGHVENTETGGTYQFNEPAALVFSRCDGRHSLIEIAAALADRYGLPVGLALLDCREQLFRMAKAGLVCIPGTNGDDPTAADLRGEC